MCQDGAVGEVDETGRRKVRPIPGSEFTSFCDNVILAIGQEVDTDVLSKDVKLETTPWSSKRVDPLSFPTNGSESGKTVQTSNGSTKVFDYDLLLTHWSTIKADHVTLETNIKGVFSGGDAVWGAGTIIEAIGAGKEAAISIDRFINSQSLREGLEEQPEVAHPTIEGERKISKVPMRYLPMKERKNNFEEVELGYSEEEAIEEARRCLNCGNCSECYECVQTCKAYAIDHTMKPQTVVVTVGAIVVVQALISMIP